MKHFAFFLFLAVLVCALSACSVSDGEGVPFDANQSIPRKILSADNKSAAEAILLLDTETQNPLNAAAYMLQNADGSAIQFFDYVILSYAYLIKERGFTSLALTRSLQHILDNNVTYIKPLKERGIKVVIEVRSGDFSDSSGGISAGLGTMDVAAIDSFITYLKNFTVAYGVDGFDFNDIGGGYNSYPPQTEFLRQFQKDTPLYRDSLFKDSDGNRLSPDSIEAKLWSEGGSNFTNLLQRTNEDLKKKYSSFFSNGVSKETEVPRLVVSSIMAHTTGHGTYLLELLRNEYMPDAYSGADQNLLGNIRYILRDGPWDDTCAHMPLYNEGEARDTGEIYDSKYAPFSVDLQNRPGGAAADATALEWAKNFADEDGDRYKYGGLLFKNLPPADTAGYDIAAYLSIFTRKLFNRPVTAAGSANYTAAR